MIKKKVRWLLISMMLATAGCGWNASPADLVQTPRVAQDQLALNQTIERYLPAGAKLVIPLRPKQASAVNRFDVDGDGSADAVVFYREEEMDYKIHALILRQTAAGWEKAGEWQEFGQDVDYFEVREVTGDRQPDFLIGVRGSTEETGSFFLCALQDQRVLPVWQQSYAELAVGDLDQDGQAEVAIVTHDREQFTSRAAVYGAKEGRFQQIASLELEGAINGYTQAMIGKADERTVGLFLDADMGAHSAYTALLILQDGQLVSVWKQGEDETGLTFKPYTLPSMDVNGDGIVEVGIQREPPGTEDLSMAEIPWIEGWYQWDGQHGLKLVQERFADYATDLAVYIPKRWWGTYTIQRERSDAYERVSFSLMNQENQPLAPLLVIYTIKQQDWPVESLRLKETGDTVHVVGEDRVRKWVAVLPVMPEHLPKQAQTAYERLRLSKEELVTSVQMVSR